MFAKITETDPGDGSLSDLATREDFVEHLLLHGTSLELIRNLDLAYFIPSGGLIQWSVMHGLIARNIPA